MHVLVTGATGFVGSSLVQTLLRAGHGVTVVTRSSRAAARVFGTRAGYVEWQDHAGLIQAVGQSDGAVNLAGASIGSGRWTARRKELLWESRLAATRALVGAMAAVSHKPAVLVSASGVDYYPPHADRRFTEADGPGEGFLARLCSAWEHESRQAEALGTRVVLLRLGVVLGAGGALPKMLPPFRLFAGGPLGNGRQWLPWIHLDDAVGLMLHALTHSGMHGPYNAVAPEAHTNASFSKALGAAMGRPSWLPVPGFVLRAAFGEMADILLLGRRAPPHAAQAAGYAFRYPSLAAALSHVLKPTGDLPGE